eukprot:Opistho-2@29268
MSADGKNKPTESTLQYQDQLPRLPVPNLEETCSKYLASVRPVVNDADYEETSRVVNDFKRPGGAGERLHVKLVERAKEHRNWLEEWWENLAYLDWREPCAVNVNFCGPAEYEFWPAKAGSQVYRASVMAHHVLKFWQHLKTEAYPPGKNGKAPLCMHQYTKLFGVCRVPKRERDTIETFPEATHFLVIRKGHIFTVDALTQDGDLVSEEELERRILAIKNIADSLGASDCVGVLTAENRTVWAEAQEILHSISPKNKASLEAIHSSLFALVLDAATPANMEEVARHSLTGDATSRWFDKPLQVIVYENGLAGINGEHAPADAMVCVNCMSWVHDSIKKSLAAKPHHGNPLSHSAVVPAPKPISLDINTVVERMIVRAKDHYHAHSSAVDLTVMQYKGFGKELLKQAKMHPDAVFQMALQLAYYRLYGKPAPTYETAQTRMFFHGRTETCRSCSIASTEWAKAMVDPSQSAQNRIRLFRAAIQSHLKYHGEASQGRGCDRHLFALYVLAKENGEEPHRLYTDRSYLASGGGGNFVISTSLIGYTPVWGGFTAMVKHGYGTCYNIRDHGINAIVTGWKDGGAKHNATEFKQSIEKSLDDIKALAEANVKADGQAKAKL